MEMNKKEVIWIREPGPGKQDERTSSSQSEPKFRSRRAHTKSRGGCQNCKKLKIKCDETKPRCEQCTHRRTSCIFPKTPPKEPNTSNPTHPIFSPPAPHDQLITQALSVLQSPNSLCPAFFSAPTHQISPAQHLLNHFLNTSTSWLGSPACQSILQTYGLTLSLKTPHMIHSILSISASHLAFLNPEEKKWSLAASVHYKLSLTQYSEALNEGVKKENLEAVFGSCFLQSMLAFGNVGGGIMGEGVQDAISGETEGGDRMNKLDFTWLRAMQGIKILQNVVGFRTLLKDNIWLPVFMESKGWEDTRCEHLIERPGVSSWGLEASRRLHELCGVPMSSREVADGDENVYREPLKLLCRLFSCPLDPRSIGTFMVFIGYLSAAFVALLEEEDVRALLLLGYWAALIGGIDQWWITRSTTVIREELRAKLLLATRDEDDSAIMNLLEFLELRD